ncbi:hypothetical protein FBZ85_11690 [Azospirillum brasilense]|uniref:Uncharacterized protein n=1 Tax=Azospirillum baldaniorum TaxID=1064539 RepID=A0A9P1JTC3_9PROT|nr:hypothetical protein [Azospirillum baldaniorum]TWA73398.1 hypothetical protein FBZ85_11690 [Azospirillum brasilense]CCC99402.1 protein of unknown function [Azospirillum baldaniorum]
MADIYYDRDGWWIATDCLPIGPFDTVSEAQSYADTADELEMVEA